MFSIIDSLRIELNEGGDLKVRLQSIKMYKSFDEIAKRREERLRVLMKADKGIPLKLDKD